MLDPLVVPILSAVLTGSWVETMELFNLIIHITTTNIYVFVFGQHDIKNCWPTTNAIVKISL